MMHVAAAAAATARPTKTWLKRMAGISDDMRVSVGTARKNKGSRRK